MQVTASLGQDDCPQFLTMTGRHHSHNAVQEGSKQEHKHSHGAVDGELLSSERGIWAVKWSLVGLFATAAMQVLVVSYTGSVALLADTIHNFGDALTALPLWLAFSLSRRPATKRFTYGYGRIEDLAGLIVLVMILVSGLIAGYESIKRLIEPQEVRNLWAVIAASIIGFAGNEGVALFRIRVGKEIGSAALVADGYHARVDGLTSLAVLAGAVGVWLGYPLADPIIGLLISAAIFKILWDAGKSVLLRVLDGVDPKVVDEIRWTVQVIEGVEEVQDVRVRWLGHRMQADLSIAVDPNLDVSEGHKIAMDVQHRLLHQLKYLAYATIHIDPANLSGSIHHNVDSHEHDDLPAHPH